MPNPRNRLKLTGDTHLPDVDEGGGGDEDTLRFEPAEDVGGDEPSGAPLSGPALQGRGGSMVDAAREQIRQRPVATLAAAFALGWLFARI
jgi:hypothetical protein